MSSRDLRDRLLDVHPPHARRSVDVAIPDGSIEISTGEGGVGVSLTLWLARQGRYVTLSVGEDAADRLARTLAQAVEASALNRRTSGGKK